MPLPSLLRSTVLVAGCLPLALALLDCDKDEFEPLDIPFGSGGGDGGGAHADGTVPSSSGSSGSADGGTPPPSDNPYAGDGINDDPNFDPTADGGYWSTYDAGDAGYLEDGAVNGGPEVYKDYGHCPLVKVAAFQLDGNPEEATVYGADFTPEVPGTVNRLNVLLASNVPFSYFGPFFPLGFIDPPWLDPVTPKVDTFPFPTCKRCVFAATGDPDTEFVAIGGMLSMAPLPNPRSGRISARLDLAVLIEARKVGTYFYPVPSPRCIRVLTAPIIVR